MKQVSDKEIRFMFPMCMERFGSGPWVSGKQRLSLYIGRSHKLDILRLFLNITRRICNEQA
jgi:hypothetical protein